MRFVNTIHLCQDDLDKIRRGVLRIQIGQWVWLPYATSPSRFTGVDSLGYVRFLHTPVSTYDLVKECKNMKRFKFTRQYMLFAV